jgi:predicted XRE-type DNA-binding protein
MADNTPRPRIDESSGNVFEDLGFSDANERLAKSELAMRVVEILSRRRLTQVKVGELLGVPQPKISDLMNGRLKGFSTERLIRFLLILGYDVDLQIKRSATNRKHGEYRIVDPGRRSQRFTLQEGVVKAARKKRA